MLNIINTIDSFQNTIDSFQSQPVSPMMTPTSTIISNIYPLKFLTKGYVSTYSSYPLIFHIFIPLIHKKSLKLCKYLLHYPQKSIEYIKSI